MRRQCCLTARAAGRQRPAGAAGSGCTGQAAGEDQGGSGLDTVIAGTCRPAGKRAAPQNTLPAARRFLPPVVGSAHSPQLFGTCSCWGGSAWKTFKRTQLGCTLEENQVLKPWTFDETVLVCRPTPLLSPSTAGPEGTMMRIEFDVLPSMGQRKSLSTFSTSPTISDGSIAFGKAAIVSAATKEALGTSINF